MVIILMVLFIQLVVKKVFENLKVSIIQLVKWKYYLEYFIQVIRANYY